MLFHKHKTTFIFLTPETVESIIIRRYGASSYANGKVFWWSGGVCKGHELTCSIIAVFVRCKYFIWNRTKSRQFLNHHKDCASVLLICELSTLVYV